MPKFYVPALRHECSRPQVPSIQAEVAKRMGWSVAKAAQMTNVFFSEISGGGGGSGNGDSSGGSVPAPVRKPDPGVGGNGTASEFGDLTRLTRKEVDTFLRRRGATVKGPTPDGYVEYKFPDKSKVTIRPDGEVVRTPAPKYGTDGRNINRGLRLGKDGSLLRTRDQFGDEIPRTHNTGERVSD